MSGLEETLALLIKAAELPLPEREYRFAAHLVGTGKGLRKRLEEAGLKDWRFDFAWPEQKIAVEVEGGAWTRGRHTRGHGFVADIEKYNAAVLLGWRLFRFATNHISSGYALNLVKKAVAQSLKENTPYES